MSIKDLPDYDALYNKKLTELKEKREYLFKKLDILFLKSLETDDLSLKQEITSAKNSLRDFPESMKEVQFESFADLNSWIPDYFNIDKFNQ